MSSNRSLDIFIERFAARMAEIYRNNCADQDDYIQAGHLKLAEIENGKYERKDNQAYSIVAVSRAMRDAAIEAMFAASAPHIVKIKVHKLETLLGSGKTEREAAEELGISKEEFTILKSLIHPESWNALFSEQSVEFSPFDVLDDLFSSGLLTENDKTFLQAHIDGTVDELGLSRKQQWSKAMSLRPKLLRSGYGR